MLRLTGSQRVGHDLAMEQQQDQYLGSSGAVTCRAGLEILAFGLKCCSSHHPVCTVCSVLTPSRTCGLGS